VEISDAHLRHRAFVLALLGHGLALAGVFGAQGGPDNLLFAQPFRLVSLAEAEMPPEPASQPAQAHVAKAQAATLPPAATPAANVSPPVSPPTPLPAPAPATTTPASSPLPAHSPVALAETDTVALAVQPSGAEASGMATGEITAGKPLAGPVAVASSTVGGAPVQGSAATQAAQVEDAPHPLAYDSNPPPIYPAAARRRELQGDVLLEVRVAENGQVTQVVLKRGSGHAILDNAALETVRAWRFRPARLGGRPIAGIALVPVKYRLND
jgi:periplasmic protein TonB